MARPKPPGEISDAFRDETESVDALIQRKQTKEITMSKENALAPNNWLLNNFDLPTVADAPPPQASGGGVFPHPFPMVKINQRDANQKRTPFFVCETADDKEAFLVPGLPLRDPSTKGKTQPSIVRIAPIWAYTRHSMWGNNGMEFEHPTSFGPFVQTGSDGRDGLRLIWYDVDRDSFYFMDLEATGSRHEALAFAYHAIWGEAKAGRNPYEKVYTMTTIKKDGKQGPYFQLRIMRADDVITPQYTSLASDGGGVPIYDVIDLATATAAKGQRSPQEILQRLTDRMNGPTMEIAAVHLLGMSGMDAMRNIRKLQNAEITVEEVLKQPRGMALDKNADKPSGSPAIPSAQEYFNGDSYLS